MATELERIARLRERLGRGGADVEVGIGDDAAVLAAGSGRLVWTVDAQVEGTHFRSDLASWEDVGWRSFMAAASDVAAMGADPVAALSSLVLAPSVDDVALEALAQGQALASEAVGAPVVGGNLARGTETSVTTTLLGRVDTGAAVVRSGARPGDAVWLAGPVGLAAAGLAALLRDGASGLGLEACVEAWRRPRARIAEGRAMRALASAAVDVSDGLARDAGHLAAASGVRVVLDPAALLAHGGVELDRAARALGLDPIDLALHGGEDYALLATAPAGPGFLPAAAAAAAGPGFLKGHAAERRARAELGPIPDAAHPKSARDAAVLPRSTLPGFTRIGHIESAGAAAGVFVDRAGRLEAVDLRGFDHFDRR